MRAVHLPTGIEQIRSAVHALDAADLQVATQEAVVAEKRAELAKAEAERDRIVAERQAVERDLAVILASGNCSQNGCTLDHSTLTPRSNGHPEGTQAATPEAPSAAPVIATQAQIDLADATVPIVWRIAFNLLADPQLDYAAYGTKIWGPEIPFKKVKNRISSNLAYLVDQGVATALGSNAYRIDRAKLAERSKLPVEAAP